MNEAPMKKIPYGRQHVSEADKHAVLDVLESDFLTQGPVVPSFEGAIASYCGARHAVAVSSATAGLHIAYLALGLKAGDLVWTSPITFVATTNCALHCGADVDFVDIDPKSYNICPALLEEKLRQAHTLGRLPKIVVPVHMSGQSCDMEAIHFLSLKYGFKIVEDASHAIGAKYKGQPVGNCRYSDLTVFSFHPVKIITTGEGGMVLCNSDVYARKLTQIRSHGISNNPNDLEARPGDEIWNYQQFQLGFNFRMTELQAALGLSQLQMLDTFVHKRHSLADLYDKTLSDLPVVTPWQHPYSYSSYHLYLILLPKECSVAQKQVYLGMHSAGIQVNLHYIPVYLHPFYAAMGFQRGHCPNSEDYFKRVMSLPLFVDLSLEEHSYVCRQLALQLN